MITLHINSVGTLIIQNGCPATLPVSAQKGIALPLAIAEAVMERRRETRGGRICPKCQGQKRGEGIGELGCLELLTCSECRGRGRVG